MDGSSLRSHSIGLARSLAGALDSHNESRMTEMEHSSALIRAFIVPERRARLLGLLKSPRGREKLRRSLAHLRDLDPRFCHLVPAAEQTPVAIVALLRAKGAPAECVLLAEDASLDGRRLGLKDALAAVIGRGMGAIVSCLPGRLAYYEAEDRGERYLLERAI